MQTDKENNTREITLRPEDETWDIYRKVQFHKRNLNGLRNRLGKMCSYLSYVRSGEEYGIKAILNGKKVDVALGGTPDDVTEKGYEDLYEQLRDHGENK